MTDLAILGFDETTKRMQLESLHEGVDLEEVQNRTGFDLLIKNPLDSTLPPSPTELTVLRNEVDPHRFIIGRG